MMLNCKSGEHLCEPRKLPLNQVPQHICWIESEQLVLIGINAISESSLTMVTSILDGFSLFNPDGMLGLWKHFGNQYKSGTIMDIKN